MPDQNFRRLFAETENAQWDSVERVRDRARRRAAVRTSMVGAVVAIGLVSGGVALARDNRSPSPQPAPAASVTTPPPAPSSPVPTSPTSPSSPPPSSSTSKAPPPTDVTAEMMLQPSDVGSGYAVENGELDGDWTFEFNAGALGCPSLPKPEAVAGMDRILRKGPEQFVLQQTTLFTRGGAGTYLDGVRDRVGSCTPPAGQSVRIVSRDFAGAESLLIVFDHGGGSRAKIVLVRTGDLLTEIFSKPDPSESVSRSLGSKAAARLS
ncbi:hypothetical protein JIG36_02220 [Actinoplanes sp. LDG1-06]|uniref:Uncharacterized protein n=1 Tax=Paractinoplanes ovalisporus TaxID=2810368 RepID=A0ABS2A3H1_9ACTN|nr:hypothetical protein [Actinoplanes ovalisporus]MBM2614372.1 hypothetical protein [Actinoplanes ovalisporus]